MNYTPQDDPISVYKHIVKTPIGHYKIVKTLNGKYKDFGTFKTRANAVYERDLLISVDWDYELLCEMETLPTPFTDNDLPRFPEHRCKGGRPSGGLFGFKGVNYSLRKNNPWTRVWCTSITHHGHRKFISHFSDPLTGQIVYNIVKEEIMKVSP